MSGTTGNGWPYVTPDDHPVEFPAFSQQLALLLDDRAPTDWVSWSPTVGGAVYSSVLAKWIRHGSLVTVQVKATVSSVSGALTFTPPVQHHTDQVGSAIGVARCLVASSAYFLWVYASGGNTINVSIGGVNGLLAQVTSSTPATWQSGNTVQFVATYRSV